MTGPIMLDREASDAVQAAADEFGARVRELIAPYAPADQAMAINFAASVGVQGVLRGLYKPEGEDFSAQILMGGGEGVGMLLGLMEDPYTRMVIFQHIVKAMHDGMQSQAQIHQPAGEA